jgi:hypothetical protein
MPLADVLNVIPKVDTDFDTVVWAARAVSFLKEAMRETSGRKSR